jgi:hypothetical protein
MGAALRVAQTWKVQRLSLIRLDIDITPFDFDCKNGPTLEKPRQPGGRRTMTHELRPCFFCQKETQDWEVALVTIPGEKMHEGYVLCLDCKRCLNPEQMEAHIHDYLLVRGANLGLISRDVPHVREAAKREYTRMKRWEVEQ